MAGLLAASMARAPFSCCERLVAASRLRRAPPHRAPVFILGHWRSGTTHLFNLMSRDPRFAWADPFATGLPWDFLLLGRLVRPLGERLLPKRRFIDDVPVSPDSPQEDEIALASMQNVSYYHGIYFPSRFARHFSRGVLLDDVSDRELDRWCRRFGHYNRKLLIGRTEKTPLIKNPVYTGRVALIRELWSGARFVHIHRNPYVVYESTRKFYQSLLPRFALQEFGDDVADDLILDSYPKMMESLYKDVEDIGPSRFVELRFEDLEKEPLSEIERIYASLAIPGFSDVQPVFRRYLESVSTYKKSTHVLTDEVIGRVDRHWGGLVRRWGYTAP